MAEMALQRRQAGAVAPPDEPRERLATLIGGQVPGAALVFRPGKERRQSFVQADMSQGCSQEGDGHHSPKRRASNAELGETGGPLPAKLSQWCGWTLLVWAFLSDLSQHT